MTFPPRHIAMIAASLAAVYAGAATPGIEYLDTLATPVGTADIHLRVDTRDRASTWGLAYNITGDRYDFVTVDNPENRFDNDIAASICVTTGSCDGVTTITGNKYIIDRGVDVSDSRWSLLLKTDGDSATIIVGQKTPLLSIGTSVDTANGIFALLSDKKTKVIRHTIESKVATPVCRAPFDNIRQLETYIAGTTDPFERIWSYLDRDTDLRRVTPGGNYTLATVSDGKGGYDIVYLDGARVRNKDWQPLMIKGRLKATPFIGHFDLIWLDAKGNPAPGETNATIENNNSILRLDFPSHNSQVRFAAMPRR